MNVYIGLCLLFTVLFDDCSSETKSEDTKYDKLVKFLLRNSSNPYNRNLFPSDLSSYTDVSMNIGLNHIQKVDEVRQVLTTQGWISFSWEDSRLSWDSNKFGLYVFRIRSWKIWKPRISMFNQATGTKRSINFWQNQPRIYHSGHVYHWGPATFSVTCEFDYTDFPFDEQTCPIVIGDWVHTADEVTVTNRLNQSKINSYLGGYGMSKKVHAAGWEVKDTWRKHGYLGIAGLVDEIPQGHERKDYWSFAEYWIKIKRHRPYYGIIDVMPGVVTSFLTLTVFFIDSQTFVLSIILVNLSMQALFSFDLLQTLAPNSGGTPKIVKLYGANFAMTAIALFLHIFLYQIQFKCRNVSLSATLRSMGQKMYSYRGFSAKNLQFDPQKFFDEENRKETEILADNIYKQNDPEDVEEKTGKDLSLPDYISVVRRLLFLVFLLVYCFVLVITILI